MRYTGKITTYTPMMEVRTKEGQPVMGNDGNVLMKRTIVVDCSYESEDGHPIRDVHVCDTFREFSDEQLEAWRTSGKKVAAYIFGDGHQSATGSWFCGEKVTNIQDISF